MNKFLLSMMVCFFGMGALSSSVLAQTAVMLPVAGHQGVSPEQTRDVIQTTVSELRAQGYTVITHPEVLERLDDDDALRNCVDGSCIAALIESLDADVAVGLALWARRGRSGLMQVYDVVVSFQDAFGRVVEARAEVKAQRIKEACKRAYGDASHKKKAHGLGRRGHGHGLEHEGSGLSRPSGWNYVLGAGLGLAGVGLGVYGAVHALRDGDCIGDTNSAGLCSERISFDTGQLVSLIAGGVLLGAGVAVLLWMPIRVSVDVNSERASLNVSGMF